MTSRDEVGEAREAGEAVQESTTNASGRSSTFRNSQRPPSSYRLTSALSRAVAAAASTGAGLARESVGSAVAAVTSRRDTRGDSVSDAALRRVVDRIAAEHGMFDASVNAVNARLNAATRGLCQAEIDKLPDLRWGMCSKETTWKGADTAKTKEKTKDADSDDATPADFRSRLTTPDECPVCFVSFEPGDWLKNLPCGHHQFHLMCIQTWLERVPTCPLCRCACRSVPVGNVPGGDDVSIGEFGDGYATGAVQRDFGDDVDDPDFHTETFATHLGSLTAMHEEESTWLDRLEGQSFIRGAGRETGRETVEPQIPLLDDSLTITRRRNAFVSFDPNATSYMRRNYSTLLELREEERGLVRRLDQLAVTERALHLRIADATRRRDDALSARHAETREEARQARNGNGVGVSIGVNLRDAWRSTSAMDLPFEATVTTSQHRGASAALAALAAAERDHHSRVNAADALTRWRSSG